MKRINVSRLMSMPMGNIMIKTEIGFFISAQHMTMDDIIYYLNYAICSGIYVLFFYSDGEVTIECNSNTHSRAVIDNDIYELIAD